MLLAKSRQSKNNNANQTELEDNGITIEDTLNKIQQDQSKLVYFWEGVRNSVNAHELKKKHEHSSPFKIPQHIQQGVSIKVSNFNDWL